jgi:hypothetical protein
MTGFIVGDKNMGPLYVKERNENVAKWLHEGSFKSKSSITDGIDNAADGLVGMLQVNVFSFAYWLNVNFYIGEELRKGGFEDCGPGMFQDFAKPPAKMSLISASDSYHLCLF